MTLMTANRPCAPSRFSLLRVLTSAHGTWRQRQTLRALDADALKDIGISKSEAQAEAKRPLWDAPETWRC
ncbi:DUF1127 domain-containing protein [Phaeobacter sp. NW0010-22]|uniref:DUF1127 domain-containing protein n=1 Tax=Phaeobacter sp. NW0010-22 TaxID=3135907 RepID=UPI000EFA7DC3